MRLKVVAFATVLLAVPYAAYGISINSISQIISFGDSLSDAGNAFIGSSGLYPGPNYATRSVPGVPTPVGYFTDGPNTTPGTGSGPTGLWIDQLAAKMGLTDPAPALAGGTNYAVGSALTGSTNPQDMGNQLALFLSQHPTGAPSSALYTFWGGANDLLSSGVNPATAANNIMAEIQMVAADGGKYFLWLNLPPLGDTPGVEAGGSTDIAAADAATAAFNAQYNTDVATLDAEGITVISVDVDTLFNQLLANPLGYGFTNTTQPCQGNSACTNPNQYVFWDALHPTTEADSYVAALAFNAVAAPEPASSALIVLGGCGLLALFRTRRKQSTN